MQCLCTSILLPKKNGASSAEAFHKQGFLMERQLSSALSKHVYHPDMKITPVPSAWYKRGAQLGNPACQRAVAVDLLISPENVTDDLNKNVLQSDIVLSALHIYFAAVGGDLPALIMMGYMHEHGYGSNIRRCPTSVQFYRHAAHLISAEQWTLNNIYSSMQKDYHQSLGLASNGNDLFPSHQRTLQFPFLLTLENIRTSASETKYFWNKPFNYLWDYFDSLLRTFTGFLFDKHRTHVSNYAVEYLKQRGLNGDAQAQVTLGHLYLYGAKTLQQNDVVAFNYFRAAADSGNVEAMSYLGHMYMRGNGINQDLLAAEKWLRSAAEAGSARALTGLGYLYMKQDFIRKNFTTAYHHFKKAAMDGDQDAVYNMGNMLLEGISIKRNIFKARNMYAIAASHGHIYSMMKLGDMAIAGLGSIANCRRGLEIYKQITRKKKWENTYSVKDLRFNSSPAIFSMSDAYTMFHDGKIKDAFKSYFQLGLMGYGKALKNAAWLLMQRINSIPSANAEWSLRVKLSLSLYRRSGQQGSIESLLRIGDIFYYGEKDYGVKPQIHRAAHYYRKASVAKSIEGHFNLGFMHGFGIGLPKDIHLAKRQFDAAAQLAPPGQKIAIDVSSAFTWIYHKFYNVGMAQALYNWFLDILVGK